MSDYQMELSVEEKEILKGAKGKTLQKVIKSLVLYGETFGARRLVPLDGPVHLVTSFGIPILEPVFEMMDELIEADLKTKEPFTVDPRPLDYDNVKVNLLYKYVFKIMYGKQEEYEEQLEKVGLKNKQAFTCACYLAEVGNRPGLGDVLAWAESSAVVFANSVLGAKTNRNSGIIELFSGILGKTPEFGFLTKEGRKAHWLVEIKTTKTPSAQVLGSAIGMKVMEDVPYIVGLDKYLGQGLNDDTEDYLKDMGAATASNGAVGLFHVEGITPEAIADERNLLRDDYQTYVIDDAELERIVNNYPVMWSSENAKAKVCFIGCPHLSLNQLYQWTERIKEALDNEGKNRVEVHTILTAAPDVINKFKEDKEQYQRLIETGVKLTSICPLMYMNNPLASKQAVITNSNKLRTYTTARFLEDKDIVKVIINRRRFNQYE